MSLTKQRIAIVMASLRMGGAEKAMINLANMLYEKGLDVSLIVLEKDGEFATNVSNGIQIHTLQKKRARFSILAFRKILFKEAPDVLIVIQLHIQVMAILAIILCRWKGKLILNEQSNFSQNTKSSFLKSLASKLFNRAQHISVVSRGAAADFSGQFPKLASKVCVIPNPIDVENILLKREEAIEHPFLKNKVFPVVLTAGRLSPEKNHMYLLLAFYFLLKKKVARLVILGDGKEKRELLEFAEKLGILPFVSFTGNVGNPYPYMKQCDVFVLSSLYEGLPTVLLEALLCGCNIVSTDCRFGPSEILNDGEFGKLVPLTDAEGFANAILEKIDALENTSKKFERAKDFSSQRVSEMYLELIRKN